MSTQTCSECDTELAGDDCTNPFCDRWRFSVEPIKAWDRAEPTWTVEWSDAGQKWCAWIIDRETIGTFTTREEAEEAARQYVAARS